MGAHTTRHRALARSATLIGEFDSTEQSAIFRTSATRAAAVAQLTGLLRTGLLVSDVVFVTDVMIFDGAYFAELDPHDLGRELGMSSRDLPLVVLSWPFDEGHDGRRQQPTADFARAFARRFDDPGFIWQLEQLGYDRSAIRAHASRWIDAHATGLFEVVPWGGQGDATMLRDGAFLSRDAALPLPTMRTERGGRILEQQTTAASRSALLRGLGAARRAASADELADIADIEQWWLDAYLRELARRNEAGWVRFLGTASTSSPDDAQASLAAARSRLFARRARADRDDGVVELRGDLVDLVAEASPAAFGAARFAVRAQRRRFVAKPSAWHLNSLTFAALDRFDAPDRMRLLRSALLRSILATGGTVLSTLAFPGLGDGLFIVIGLAVLLSTMPWSDLIDSVRLLFLPPSARVMVSGGSRRPSGRTKVPS